MTASIEVRLDRISELEKKCRDILLYEAVFKNLTQRGGQHDKICALLDFVGDSEDALASVASANKRGDIDFYFLAYGLLQLMYSRQVAMGAVLEACAIPVPASWKTGPLATVRHRIIGHPVTSDGAAHVIVRNTLNQDGFEYWSYRGSETERHREVRYDVLLSDHLDLMIEGLGLPFRLLADIENQRRETMRREPLTPMLQGISYATQCMATAILEEKNQVRFSVNSDAVLSSLEALRQGLVKRYGADRAADEIDHVTEGVRMLQGLFPPVNQTARRQFQIVADGIDANMKKLIELASEVDATEARKVE